MPAETASVAALPPDPPRAGPMLPFGLEDRRQQRRVRLVKGLFVVGLVAWTSLAGWWAVYFYRATLAVRESKLETLAAIEMLYASHFDKALGLDDFVSTLPPQLAVVDGPLDEESKGYPYVEVPLGGRPTHAIVIAPELRSRLRGETHSKMLMLAGEGTLLVGLLFVVQFALYRLLVGEWRLNRQRDSFVHAVSHELKSPLAGLRALLQSFEAIEMTAAERASYVAMGLGELRRLDGMVGNILLSTRLEANTFTAHVEEVDLAGVLSRLAERRRLQFAERGGALVVEIGAVRARFDPEALESILENLVENALKYTGDKPQVRIEARTAGGRVEVRVADNGIGLGPADRLKVFEKFYRTPEGEQKAAKGTGLGLFIARGLARACGGELRAESDGPGRGATFVLELGA